MQIDLKKYIKHISILKIIGAVVLFTMCQEPYFNDDLDTRAKIPVFNGILSNLDNISTFELYYAMPYTNQRMERIPGALITIGDGENIVVELDELSPGIYKLPYESSSLPTNRAYTAKIELTNGEVIKSTPIYYYDTLPITHLFFDFNIQSRLVKNAAGNFSTVSEEGIVVQFRLKKPDVEPAYYRASANYYVHSEKWVNRTRPLIYNEPHYDIAYEIRYDTLYDIYEGFTNTNFPIVGALLPYLDYSGSDLIVTPLFLPADRECRNFSHYTSNTFVEWVIPIDLYHNSKEVYQYYTNAAKQLTATGQIFDPIPEQLTGNMYNETHPTQAVLGLFDISSVNRKYMSVYVYEALGYRSYQSRILTDTIIKQGWYPRMYFVDTVFVDTIPIIN